MNSSNEPAAAVPASAPLWMRVAFVAVGLAAWFASQALIGNRPFPEGAIGDSIHHWTAPLHDYLFDHPRVGSALLITSSAVVDLMGVSLLLLSIRQVGAALPGAVDAVRTATNSRAALPAR